MKYYELKEFQEQRNDYYKKTTAFFDKKIDFNYEMINYATDEFGDTPETFSCPLCLGLVYKPVTCTICQHDLYCSNCVSKIPG